MIRRGRMLSVMAILIAGTLAIISSTQTWLVVILTSGGEPLPVPGASAIPVLAPLSLAVLALGGALSIAGIILRYVFGALTAGAGAALLGLIAPVAFGTPSSAVVSTVSQATGISGVDAVSTLVARIGATPWPAITLVSGVLLLAAAALTLITARRWRTAGHRYDTTHPMATASPTTTLDAVDSWDDLSRGQDPTG